MDATPNNWSKIFMVLGQLLLLSCGAATSDSSAPTIAYKLARENTGQMTNSLLLTHW